MWLLFRLFQKLHLSDSTSPRQRDAPVPLLGSSLTGPLLRGPCDPVTVATVPDPFQPVFLVEFSPRNQGKPRVTGPHGGSLPGRVPSAGFPLRCSTCSPREGSTARQCFSVRAAKAGLGVGRSRIQMAIMLFPGGDARCLCASCSRTARPSPRSCCSALNTPTLSPATFLQCSHHSQ